ncbi:CopD family protein [Anaplasma phagocytophilum]|uniref:CopD family protein n=1 Tax=Anaplasma phagocytophilum TaxID=948 RepID=UPI00200EA1A5|nr:CopD family protein [Anaplasma phagocytophilum]UQD54314.1 CopD family protein [Anaplasma phagocytophilum]
MLLSRELHRWLEAFHVISVVMWMAGMLYLPRLFVYHANTEPGSETSALLATMERRLLFYIMNPAMASAVLLGLTLAITSNAHLFVWFRIKSVLLVCMIYMHCLFVKYRKDFSLDIRVHSSFFFRVLNEIVTVLLIGIIIMAVVKPFR